MMYHTICKTCANEHSTDDPADPDDGLEVVHEDYFDGVKSRGFHGHFHENHDMITRRVA